LNWEVGGVHLKGSGHEGCASEEVYNSYTVMLWLGGSRDLLRLTPPPPTFCPYRDDPSATSELNELLYSSINDRLKANHVDPNLVGAVS
jgi:hypothetical protein